MNFKELGLEIIEEKASKGVKDELISLYNGITQGRSDREMMFLELCDSSKGVAFALMKLKRHIVENRELDTKLILDQIHRAENNNDTVELIKVIGELFLEDIDVKYLDFLKPRMTRQGWTWDTLIVEYSCKQEMRVNSLLNIPYDRYVKI